jgi:hypothetical protein
MQQQKFEEDKEHGRFTESSLQRQMYINIDWHERISFCTNILPDTSYYINGNISTDQEILYRFFQSRQSPLPFRKQAATEHFAWIFLVEDIPLCLSIIFKLKKSIYLVKHNYLTFY